MTSKSSIHFAKCRAGAAPERHNARQYSNDDFRPSYFLPTEDQQDNTFRDLLEPRDTSTPDAAARAVQAGQPGQAEDGTADTDEQAEQAAQRRKHQQPELTAAQIVLALKQSKDWIGEPDTGKYVDRKCRHFTEFRADTGSSRAARRFDLLCIETLTAAERDTVVIRGVEIKVSKSDLEQDHKMQEYCAFCDAFYIAVPDVPEMIQTAEAVRLPAWGLLAITAAGALKIIHAAVLQPGLMRDKTIAAALIKLM